MVNKIIPYKNRKNSYIVVKKINEPYGPGSEPVISIGSTLKGNTENPTWKVHIPVDIVSAVVQGISDAVLEGMDFVSLNDDGCL
tara:strand:+ start:510 stop:761 length:252 start_codon:yes stop_codon:yes gene_type:complete